MKKPIRIGLIGCGGIVQNTHARAYRSLTETVKVTALARGYCYRSPSKGW